LEIYYEKDVWRAMRVKNSNTLKNYEDYRFIDSADFKKIKKDGDEAGYR
jgi:hypothetical protein